MKNWKQEILLLAAACCGVSAPVIAWALPITTYDATLSGAAESPPTGSTATGFATLTVNGNMLEVSLTFSGLTSPASVAHIHCCSPPGINSAVAVPLNAFPATTSGAYVNNFDLMIPSPYSGSFITANGGTAAGAEAVLLAGLGAGKAYVNIHDSFFPTGEIRGFTSLAAPNGVPEPASLLLFGVAGLALAWSRRSGRRR